VSSCDKLTPGPPRLGAGVRQISRAVSASSGSRSPFSRGFRRARVGVGVQRRHWKGDKGQRHDKISQGAAAPRSTGDLLLVHCKKSHRASVLTRFNGNNLITLNSSWVMMCPHNQYHNLQCASLLSPLVQRTLLHRLAQSPQEVFPIASVL
jgi:hypothetical protein